MNLNSFIFSYIFITFAAPAVALVTHEIGVGKNVTCYPALKGRFPEDKYTFVDEPVVIDGKVYLKSSYRIIVILLQFFILFVTKEYILYT